MPRLEAPEQGPTLTLAPAVRAACAACGKRSRPVLADAYGEPDIFALPSRWAVAHAATPQQASRFLCPACHAAEGPSGFLTAWAVAPHALQA